MRKTSNQAVASRSKAVGYARVSTPDQADKDLSLTAQITAIRRYAQERGLELTGEFVERGVSGTDDNRPEFQKMLQIVLRPASDIGTIIVTHSSRFMRNATKARMYKERLVKAGVRVLYVQQEVTDDPGGHLIEGMFELFDQHESEINGVRTRTGMSENAKRGYFNGSQAPFGFRVEKITTPVGIKNKLAVDRAEAELVREVFRQYLAGRGAKATAMYLNERGLLYRKLRWSRDLVLRVISDTSAIGVYYWGKHDSKRQRIRPESEWVRMDVEPIVDEEIFEMARKLRAGRDPGRSEGRLPSSPLLLSGLLHCALCGDTCQLESSGKLDPNGEPYRYYNCRRFCRSGKHTCPGYRIAADTLERAVLAHIAEHLFTEERCREILRDFVEDQGILRQKTAEQRRLLERERDELARRLERWYERIETEPDLAEVGSERLRELKAKREEVVRTLSKLKVMHTIPPYLYKPETIQRFQSRLREAFLSGDRSTARLYLQNLVERITVGADDIVIDARAGAAIAMMAASQRTHSEAGEGVVLADVVDWRAP